MKKYTYIEEKCLTPLEVTHTNKLKILDQLPSFSAYTNDNIFFNIDDLKGSFFIIYIKKNDHERFPILLLNNIGYKNLGEIVKNKGGNILIINESKAVSVYGVELVEGYKIERNTLFVADKNKIIRHIYVDVCEDDIVDIVNKLKL